MWAGELGTKDTTFFSFNLVPFYLRNLPVFQMPLRTFYFIFKDQALPASRPTGVAERHSYSVCAFGLRRAGGTKARLVWIQ